MHRIAGLLLISVIVFSAFAQTPPPASEYGALVQKLKAGDTDIDYQKLRFSYWGSPEAKAAKPTQPEQKQMIAALHSRDFQDALRNSDIVLANDYINVDAHFVAYIAHRELQHKHKSEYHQAVLQGLLKSITDSGDGESERTAFVVIDTEEEQALVHFLQLTIANTTVKESRGHSYDVVTVRDPNTGETATLYFNIDIWVNHMKESAAK